MGAGAQPEPAPGSNLTGVGATSPSNARGTLKRLGSQLDG